MLVLLAAEGRADVTITATGVYDSTNNANAVDRNANGDTLAATGGNDVAGFTSAVATAFASGTGGVIDFDSPNGGTAAVSAQTGSIVATFGNASNKMLALAVTAADPTPANANKFDLRSSTAGIATISGAFFLISNGAADTNIKLTLGGITGAGAATNERVTSVGFTLLDRSTIAGTPVVTASFSDGTTGTLNGAAFTIAGTNEDTFYSFTAPTGASVTSVTVTYNATVADARLTIDDFGFTTGIVAVPEPGALAGVGLTVALLAGYRWMSRRRSH